MLQSRINLLVICHFFLYFLHLLKTFIKVGFFLILWSLPWWSAPSSSREICFFISCLENRTEKNASHQFPWALSQNYTEYQALQGREAIDFNWCLGVKVTPLRTMDIYGQKRLSLLWECANVSNELSNGRTEAVGQRNKGSIRQWVSPV